MPSRVLMTGLGLLVSGMLVTGCGERVANLPGSTPVPSATASVPTGSSVPATSTLPATPVPSDSNAASPSAGSTTTADPSPSPSDAESETYGIDLAVVGSKLEFTPMRWYFGKDALARCKKLDIEPDGGWCNDFFFEQAGDRVSAALAEDVRIKVLTKDAKLRRATRAQLTRAISESLWPHFTIKLDNGEVVAITQVYTP